MIGCNNEDLLPVTFTQENIEMASKMGMVEFEDDGEERVEEKRGGFLSIFRGRNYAKNPEKKILPSEEGKVKETDVTSNKFVIPDREKKPLPDKTFPYKPKRTGRYIRVSQ